MKLEAELLLGGAGAYILAIMPRMRRKGRQIKGIFYAHRGLHDRSAGIPENTMAAFGRAVEEGYGIEMDVQLTADDQVVVFHDFTLKRVCGADGRVCDYTYEELLQFSVDGTEERIPLLSDVLELVDGRVPLLIEIKCPGWRAHVCEKVDEALSGYQGSYTIESFNPFALFWYRVHRPEICRGQLAMNFQRREGHFGPDRIIARHLLTNFLTRPDFIAYDIRDKEAVSKNICRKVFGCPSAAWTVRSQEQLRRVKPYYDSFIFEGFRPAKAES